MAATLILALKRKLHMRRMVKRCILMPLAAVALIAALIGVQLYFGNFHQVIRGELYRSAQPNAADIQAYVRDHGIKSILNLRGGNPGDAWYNEEVAASDANGVRHLDFRMKAARELTDEQIKQLVAMMRDAPKPLLIHCRSGSDRTGLAAALYLKEIAHQTDAEAAHQLSLRYGHLSFYINDAYAMDRTWQRATHAAPAIAAH